MSSLKLKLIIIAYTLVVGIIVLEIFGLPALKASVPYISFGAAGIFLALRIPKILERYNRR